jgi:purine-nucleoside phosphorylase
VAVLLGSGMGRAAEPFSSHASVSFDEIVGLTAPAVEGHKGAFRLCRVSGRDCLFILGRKHHYEDANDEIFQLVRYAHSLGAGKLIVVSAAGSMSRRLQPGEFLLVDRLFDLQMRAPFTNAGTFPPECVHARPSSFEVEGGKSSLSLDQELMHRIEIAAAKTGLPLRRATVACMPGPAYETPAEVRYLQNIEADAAAMSGAAEVEFANRLGMDAAVLCLVTNYATGITEDKLRHDDVLDAGDLASSALGRMLTELIGMG